MRPTCFSKVACLWGAKNIEEFDENGLRVIRVRFPAGSASPSVARKERRPLGGVGFLSRFRPCGETRLTYRVRFPEGFDFVRGGKLPGLYGGDAPSGGKIPAKAGWSVRLMWRAGGVGEVYAYLPGKPALSLGRGSWVFPTGEWVKIQLRVVLNTVGVADGRVEVYLNDALVFAASGLVFRTSENPKIAGVMFSTFFGGGDSSWATPVETFVDFAGFEVLFP